MDDEGDYGQDFGQDDFQGIDDAADLDNDFNDAEDAMEVRNLIIDVLSSCLCILFVQIRWMVPKWKLYRIMVQPLINQRESRLGT